MCLLLLLCSCRYAWIAAIWATATKRWRSTWAPPFSIAQTTTGQRLFHLPLTDLLDATGRRRPFSAYSPSCRLRRQFENKKKKRRSCCQISRQAKMPYQDVWKIIWKNKKKPAGNFKFVCFHYFCYIGRENNKIFQAFTVGRFISSLNFCKRKIKTKN